MQVFYRLAAVLSDIGYDTVAVGEAELCGDGRNGGEDLCHGGRACLVDLVRGCDMLLGYYKTVDGRLGIYVKKGVAGIVLVHLL